MVQLSRIYVNFISYLTLLAAEPGGAARADGALSFGDYDFPPFLCLGRSRWVFSYLVLLVSYVVVCIVFLFLAVWGFSGTRYIVSMARDGLILFYVLGLLYFTVQYGHGIHGFCFAPGSEPWLSSSSSSCSSLPSLRSGKGLKCDDHAVSCTPTQR